MKNASKIIAAFALAAAVPALAYAAPNPANTGVSPMIQAIDQKANGNTVKVTEVVTPRDGFVVIHAVKNGKAMAPEHLGYTAVKAGTDQSISVKLDEAPKPGTQLIAMLHNDTGMTGKFEFGPGHTEVDKPMMADGKPVTVKFKTQK